MNVFANNSVQIEPNFIVGLWRGYREEETFSMYYGYDFRSNGTYLARHRVYQKEETIQDEYWQGQWRIEKDIVYLEGLNRDRPVKMRFRLGEDNQLYYDGGTLPKPYIPVSLGRQK